MLSRKEIKEQRKADFEVLKQEFIDKMNLHPVDENHDDYYCDYKNVKIYSFKNMKIKVLRYGRSFSGYNNVSLMRNDGKQKTYNVSWVMYASSRKVPLMSWRKNGEKGTIHHENFNKLDDSPDNLELKSQKEQMDEHWKVKQKENNYNRYKKFSDELVSEIIDSFNQSGLAITRFCTLYCEKYDMNPVHMYNILRKKVRRQVTE
ncbi:Uncharacterised protein [Mycobacteroides abscessus subsp. abscessus]|nr:Uncharacterised protein [Mycobacteroides abscessus subsp. abscessus]